MLYVEAFTLGALVWLAAFYALRDLNVFAPVAVFAAAAAWAYARLPDPAAAAAGALVAGAVGLVVAGFGNGLYYHARLEPRPLAKSEAVIRKVAAIHVGAGVVAWVSGALLGMLVGSAPQNLPL